MIAIGSPCHGLIATSLFLGFAIAIFLPLRPWLRGVIGSQWLCVLWLALLTRLLLPWPLETRLGLMNSWRSQSAPTAESVVPWKVKVRFSGITDGKGNLSQVPPAPASTRSPVTAAALDIPTIIWFCGFVGSLTLLAWRGHQTRRLAARMLPATDERLLAIFSLIPAKWRRNVELRMTETVNVPTLAGIVRPQIWMPQAWLAQFTDDELHNILLHELGHVRRDDMAAQWLFAFAQCLHWFNPLVWLAARAARFDHEMACDAWVLTRNGPDASPAYGETLLKTARLLCTPSRPPAATVAIASGRRSLHARIAGIGAFSPSRTWPGLVGIALMIAALAFLTTNHSTGGETVASTASAAQMPGNPIAAPQPSLDPGLNPAIVSAGPKIAARSLVELEAKFVEIELPAWKKLCAEGPEFRKIAAKISSSEIGPEQKSYAAIQAELNNPITGGWELKKGAWEISGSPDLHILSLLEPEEMDRLLKALDPLPGLDFLSSPSVTSRLGQQATIEVIQEFRYPSDFKADAHSSSGWMPAEFVTKNMGVSLEVKPDLGPEGMISLDMVPEISRLLGFSHEKDGGRTVSTWWTEPGSSFQRPIFSISRGEFKADIKPGHTVLLGGVRIDGPYRPLNPTNTKPLFDKADNRTANPQTVNHVILIFVTADIAAPPASAAHGQAKFTQPPVKDSNLPYAVPVKGKPGFVTSPYAPNAGEIDIRGFPKNTEVKDPYTQKIFLVP